MATAKKEAPAAASRAANPASKAAGAAPPAERRADQRFEFQRGGFPLCITHPGGGQTKMTAALRNLSAGGLAFLSRGYVHPGSVCAITLLRKDGRGKRVSGKIISCRYLHDSTHEVGMKFDIRIDPGILLDISNTEGRPAEPQEPNGLAAVAPPPPA
jgi:hypothetical protein